MRYAFRTRLFGEADPQEIGEYLDALIDKRQEHVTYDEIVAAARATQSPIHKLFTWEENEAADKWRKREAKTLAKNLMVKKGDKATKTRAFVYVHHPEHGGKKVLMNARSAMARPEFREQVLEQGVRSLQRSLSYWASAYGNNPGMRALAKDVARLKTRIERDLMAAV